MRRLFEFEEDHLEHAIRVREHIGIPETDDAVAAQFEKARTAFICRIVRMLTTIEFDDQLSFDADEIGDIKSDRKLPPELETTKGAIAQALPEAEFGVRCWDAQLAGEGNVLALQFVAPPHPSHLRWAPSLSP